MQTRILVTGGSGFIGTHLVSALLRNGHTVCNVDLKRPTLSTHTPYWVKADLMDVDALNDCVNSFSPTLVYNLAAVADISVGPEALRPNSQGLRNLLNAGRTLPTPPRLVHISTQLVVRAGYDAKDVQDYAPYTAYGESKAESERILWNEASDYTWTITRPTNVWGPNHATFVQSTWKYLNRRWYLLPSGSNPVRSYGFVGNVVEQLVAAGTLQPTLVDQGVFYVGDEPIPSSLWLDGFAKSLTGKSCRRIPYGALQVLALAGEASKRIGGPAPLDAGRLYRMSTDYPVPMEPTFQTLGRGSFTLEEGIAQTVEWLRSTHPEEYKSR